MGYTEQGGGIGQLEACFSRFRDSGILEHPGNEADAGSE